MLNTFVRIAVAVLAACALSGCIFSDYDIAQQMQAELPIAAGKYSVMFNGKPASLTVTIANGTYRGEGFNAAAPSPKISYLRFFRVPEFDNYIVQAWNDPEGGQKVSYTYMYASATQNGFTLAQCCDYAALPQFLQKLVTSERSGVRVINGPRDTLYVLREIGRRNLKLSTPITYTRQ